MSSCSSMKKRITELENKTLNDGNIYYPSSAEEINELMKTEKNPVFCLNGKLFTIASFLDEVTKHNKPLVRDKDG